MSTRVVSRLEARTWDWSKCQFDPWTNPWWANRQLDILHWLKKPRPSAAPTPAELRELMEDQQLKLKLTTGMATRNGELPLGTLEKIVGGARTPTYPTLVKACAAVGIELTVTSPGGRFPEQLPADDARPAPGVLEARAPSPDDLRTMIEARVDALRNLRITPPRIARYREGVNSHSFKRIRDGEMPTYETLRTLLAAIELDLVIRPAGDPLPEELRHARFTTESEIPVVHIEQHDSGTTVEGHAIDWASAPADLEDPDAFYVISPDDRMGPSSMMAGEYCLVGRREPRREPLTRVFLHLDDDTMMLGLRVNEQGADRGYTRFVRWGTAKNEWEPELMTIPAGKIAQEATLLAIYEGRPSVTRTPPKRRSAPNFPM